MDARIGLTKKQAAELADVRCFSSEWREARSEHRWRRRCNRHGYFLPLSLTGRMRKRRREGKKNAKQPDPK